MADRGNFVIFGPKANCTLEVSELGIERNPRTSRSTRMMGIGLPEMILAFILLIKDSITDWSPFG